MLTLNPCPRAPRRRTLKRASSSSAVALLRPRRWQPATACVEGRDAAPAARAARGVCSARRNPLRERLDVRPRSDEQQRQLEHQLLARNSNGPTPVSVSTPSRAEPNKPRPQSAAAKTATAEPPRRPRGPACGLTRAQSLRAVGQAHCGGFIQRIRQRTRSAGDGYETGPWKIDVAERDLGDAERRPPLIIVGEAARSPCAPRPAHGCLRGRQRAGEFARARGRRLRPAETHCLCDLSVGLPGHRPERPSRSRPPPSAPGHRRRWLAI
jgi:hypothetical protein